jgi:hypothetical protein
MPTSCYAMTLMRGNERISDGYKRIPKISSHGSRHLVDFAPAKNGRTVGSLLVSPHDVAHADLERR